VKRAVVSNAAARYFVMVSSVWMFEAKGSSVVDLSVRRCASVVQEHNENDQRNGNSDEPKQNWHDFSPFIFSRVSD
jgi:hypothetical protein